MLIERWIPISAPIAEGAEFTSLDDIGAFEEWLEYPCEESDGEMLIRLDSHSLLVPLGSYVVLTEQGVTASLDVDELLPTHTLLRET